MKRNRPEDAMQKAVLAHLQARGARGLIYWHTPNGGRRSRTEGAIFKGLGVRAGVADLILIHNGSCYALELKAGDSARPTVAQMQFMSDFNAAGGHGCICHTLDRALRVLETWGLLRGAAAVAA